MIPVGVFDFYSLQSLWVFDFYCLQSLWVCDFYCLLSLWCKAFGLVSSHDLSQSIPIIVTDFKFTNLQFMFLGHSTYNKLPIII